MIEFATHLIESIGVIGAGVFIAIESIVIPLPSEFVLLLSGFNVSIGEFSFLAVWISTTTGSLIGALALYTLGYGVSREGIEKLVAKFGRFVGVKQRDVTAAFNWFNRYGTYAIFFGRLVPLVRSLVSIPAGLAEMNLFRFSFLTILGSGIWNAIWITAGVQLGDRWRDAEDWAIYLDRAVQVGIIFLVIYLLIKILRRRNKSNLN